MAPKKRSFFQALGLDSGQKERASEQGVPAPFTAAAGARQGGQAPAEQPKSKKKRKQKAHPPEEAKGACAGRPSSATPTAAAAKGAAGSQYPYEVDFCDHFETPLDAYRHLEPLLFWWAQFQLRKSKAELRLYDPYYCDGAVVTRLGSLGFSTVINRKRDFYKDLADKQLPQYDVCVTNPPYSGDHKERCLDFLLASNLPGCALMPNYVANKQYYRERVASRAKQGDVAYIVPTTKYEFNHPSGKGHATSPFFSIWFLFLPGFRAKGGWEWLGKWLKKHPEAGWRLVESVEELQQSGSAPAWKRPSNKKRKKLKMQREAAAAAAGAKGT